MLEANQPFPDFVLPDQDGNNLSLSDLRGKKSVIYFYPKDDTPGCTTEACAFRDARPDFGDVNIVGVSPDAPKSHRKFVDKFSLNFPLLADTEHVLSEAVGVWVEKSMYGKKYMGIERTTFILNEEGVVTKVFAKVKPAGHSDEVRAVL